jgi:hypothetical protein
MFQSGNGYPDRLGRKKQARPSQVQRQRAPYLLRVSVATAGTAILLGACLYRRVWHPEWTGGQALEALWPIYLAGSASICAAWLFGNARNE